MEKPIFLGYEASNEITIKLRDLSKYDLLMQTIIKCGVNKLEGPRFCILNEQDKRKEARIQAIKAAKEKADYLAAALQQKVCIPMKISETPEETSYCSTSNFATFTPPEEVDSSLIPRNINISSSVDVVFKLCD